MSLSKRFPYRFTYLSLALLLIISGCGSLQKPPTRPEVNSPLTSPPALALNINSVATRTKLWTNYRWFKICFRMPFQADNTPRFTSDLIIADNIIKPVLSDYQPQIPLWRFHRRAAHDDTGHQFSFIFYSTPETASAITGKVSENPVLALLTSESHIEKTILNCLGQSGQEGISFTSDKNWSPELQKTWPYFIMGVSASWLSLLNELKNSANSDAIGNSWTDTKSTDFYAYYGAIEQRMDEIWQEEGVHAFFHHTSAIFGYEPVYVRF